MHEHALASLHPGRGVKELVCGRPTQDQRSRLGRVDARRHVDQVAGPERAVGGVRPDHRHIGHAVAELKAAHVIAELIDFPDDIIAQRERGLAAHHLRVKVAPDHHIGVLQARGEHADSYLAPGGRRQGSVDHLKPVGTAEAPDLNNPVARLGHRRTPCNTCSRARAGKLPQLICRHRHGFLPIARKGHVIEEDQCVNRAFLMKGFLKRSRKPLSLPGHADEVIE
jgi:hypothetical protein